MAGGLALAVAAMTTRGRGRKLDERLYRVLNGRAGSGADPFFKGITELGSLYAPVTATGVLVASGHRREALDALGAACSMWLAGQALKKWFSRPRPYRSLEDFRLLIGEPTGESWPSVHSGVLLAFVSVASRNVDAAAAAKVGLACLAGVVGLSRVYLGVHYPADVVGGLLLGRGLADFWAASISPVALKRLPSVAVPAPMAQ